MKLAPTPLMFRDRILFLRVMVVVAFVMVLGGYYRIQILKQQHYEELGEKYRIKKRRIKASRGLVYDRNSKLITQNMPTSNIVLLRDEMESNWNQFRPELSAFLAISEEDLQARYRKGSHLLSQPVLIKENIDFSEAMRIMRNQKRFPGLAIQNHERRHYPYGTLFTHVLGYVGEASESDLRRTERLRLGDVVGKTGVESRYNQFLTGDDGERTIMIDNRGIYRSSDVTTAPSPGKDLYLTLDFELQKLAAESLEDRGGTVLMMDVRTGEMLVYISSPSFDLNLLANGINYEDYEALLKSEGNLFLNRPIQGAYAPGSIFKIVTALAGLRYGKINPNTTHFCSGSIDHFGRIRHCHRRGGHGYVNLKKAIQHSCNVYFYRLAMEIDVDQIAEVASEFGFGLPTDIDLAGEHSGLVPTREWKREQAGRVWYPGETLSVSIGQGDLLVTPIQLLKFMATVATAGRQTTPHLLLKHGKNEQFLVNEVEQQMFDKIPDEHYGLVKHAMWSVVNSSDGTGSRARVKDFDVCGKTGTAQLITFTNESQHKNDDFKNAWFAGFAPRDQARVAVVVLVEQAGAGGAQAAPIAKLLFEAYKKRYWSMEPS